MGCFSWYASDTKRAIRFCFPFPIYVLQPEGEPLKETNYDGYGEFAGEDIFNLVADWNRQYLACHPEFSVIQPGKVWNEDQKEWVSQKPMKISDFDWYPFYADLSNSHMDIEKEMKKTNNRWEYRYIGIAIACYDEQNAMLPYPIKLVEHPVPYDTAAPSNSDPKQGFGTEDRFEGEDAYY